MNVKTLESGSKWKRVRIVFVKRYENGSVHMKTQSVFGVTENEAKWKRISVDIALVAVLFSNSKWKCWSWSTLGNWPKMRKHPDVVCVVVCQIEFISATERGHGLCVLLEFCPMWLYSAMRLHLELFFQLYWMNSMKAKLKQVRLTISSTASWSTCLLLLLSIQNMVFYLWEYRNWSHTASNWARIVVAPPKMVYNWYRIWWSRNQL